MIENVVTSPQTVGTTPNCELHRIDLFDRFRPLAPRTLCHPGQLHANDLLRKNSRHLITDAGIPIENWSAESFAKALGTVGHDIAPVENSELVVELPALEDIAAALKLDLIEKTLIAFLVHIRDERFWRDLLGKLDRMTRPQTIQILSDILNLDRYRVGLALDQSGRLAKSGLLESDDFGTRFSMFLKDHFPVHKEIDLQMLRSHTAWDDFMNSKFEQASLDEKRAQFPHLQPDVELILRYLEYSLANDARGAHVLLYGPPGTGKTTLARELARSLETKLFEVRKGEPVRHEPQGMIRFKNYNLGQQLGIAKRGSLILFDELEDMLPKDSIHRRAASMQHKGWICESLENANVPTIWTTNTLDEIDPAILRRFTCVLEVGELPRSLRQSFLEDRLTATGISSDWMRMISSCRSLTPALVDQLGTVSESLSHQQKQNEPALERWLSEKLKATGESGILPANAQVQFDLSVVNIDLEPQTLLDGLKRSGQGRLCLYGPPGTGKSRFARYVAEALDREMHLKLGSDLRSPWVGETARNIARMFEQANREKAVLILDEADSFLSNRVERTRSWELNEASEFLVQLENFEGVFFATTNRFESLDAAFLRRFDFKLQFHYLNRKQAMRLFHSILESADINALPTDAELARLAELGELTPGDFATAHRGVRFSGIKLSAKSLLSALIHEVESKQINQGRRIGFM